MSGLDVSTRPVERSAETTTTETTTIEIVSLRATGIAVGLPLALLAAVALSATSGVGLAITSTAALVALATEAGLRSSAAQLCLVTVSLVPWLVVRDNTWLAICIVATVGLVLVLAAVAAATQQRIGDLSFGAVFRRQASTRPPVAAPGSDLVWSMLRGVAFAVPVVGVFWAFLAAADDVFAAVADPSRIPSSRMLLFIVLAPTLMAVSKFASDGRSSRPARTSFIAGRFGVVESSIVLGAVSLLFGAFITLRLATLNRPIDPDAWRSEVRSGFFQLLWVAALTVLLVLAPSLSIGVL